MTAREHCCEQYGTCTVDCIPRLHWHDARRSVLSEIPARFTHLYCMDCDEFVKEPCSLADCSQSALKTAAPQVPGSAGVGSDPALPAGAAVLQVLPLQPQPEAITTSTGGETRFVASAEQATPRTDAFHWGSGEPERVDYDQLWLHARQLERERNAWEEKFNAECAKHDPKVVRSSVAEKIQPHVFEVPELEGPTPVTNHLIGKVLGRMLVTDPAYRYAQRIIEHAQAMERLFWRERKSSSGMMGLLAKERARTAVASEEQAKPVAYRWRVTSVENEMPWIYSANLPDFKDSKAKWQVEPLYAAPVSATARLSDLPEANQLAADVRDAKRYRIARVLGDWSYNMKHATTPEAFDAAVDAKEPNTPEDPKRG